MTFPSRDWLMGRIFAYYAGIPIGGGPPPAPAPGGGGFLLVIDQGGTAGLGRYSTIPTLIAAANALDGPKEIYVPQDAAGVCTWQDGPIDLGGDTIAFAAPITELGNSGAPHFATLGTTQFTYVPITYFGDATLLATFSCNWSHQSATTPFSFTLIDGVAYELDINGGELARGGTSAMIDIDCATPVGVQFLTINMRGNARFDRRGGPVITIRNLGTVTIKVRIFDAAVFDVAAIDTGGVPYEVESVDGGAVILNPSVPSFMHYTGRTVSMHLAGQSPNQGANCLPQAGSGTQIVDLDTGRRWTNTPTNDGWTGVVDSVRWSPTTAKGPTSFQDIGELFAYLRGKQNPTIELNGPGPFPITNQVGFTNATFIGDYHADTGTFPTIDFGDGLVAANDGFFIGGGLDTHPDGVVFNNCTARSNNLVTPVLEVNNSMNVTCQGFAQIVGNGTAPFLHRGAAGFVNVLMNDATFINAAVGKPAITSTPGGTTQIVFDGRSRLFVNSFDPTDTTILVVPISSGVGINAAFYPRVALKVGVIFPITVADPNALPIPGVAGAVISTSAGGLNSTFWSFEGGAWVPKSIGSVVSWATPVTRAQFLALGAVASGTFNVGPVLAANTRELATEVIVVEKFTADTLATAVASVGVAAGVLDELAGNLDVKGGALGGRAGGGSNPYQSRAGQQLAMTATLTGSTMDLIHTGALTARGYFVILPVTA